MTKALVHGETVLKRMQRGGGGNGVAVGGLGGGGVGVGSGPQTRHSFKSQAKSLGLEGMRSH